MHTFRRSEPHHPAATLPSWAIWAVAPVVIALGIISGMAAATYLDTGIPIQPPPVSQSPQTEPRPVPAPTASLPPPGSNSSPAPSSSVTGQMEIPVVTQTGPSPGTGTSTPTKTAPLEIRDLRDAKAVLDESFSLYSEGGATISSIQYQLMTNSGYSKSLVGMISLRDYETWTRALAQNPQRLTSWLESAAARVRPALEKELVFLAWAVVEVRWDRPAGFTDNEVKRLSDGSYLITRPLAATIDPAQTAISLRPTDVITQGSAVPPGPWATYGPQIRFDSTDNYRPLGRDGKPIR